MITYKKWKEVPDDLKTKTQWRKNHMKVVNDDEPDAVIRYFAYKWREYKLFYRMRTVPMRSTAIRELPDTIDNLAESLYIVNKSAKKSRDTKKENYSCGNYRIVRTAKTRQEKLYALKDAALSKLVDQGKAELIGFHTQKIEYIEQYRDYGEEDYDYDDHPYDYQDDNDYEVKERTITETNYLLLYRIGKFLFHVPSTEVECRGLCNLGEIGIIDAERSVKCNIKFAEAVQLLKRYCNRIEIKL